MPAENMGPNIARSALIIVDMQNDFLHRDGSFAHLAREHPEAKIDMPFLIGTIPNVKTLADSFRVSGRPVLYVAHVLRPDYSDAAFPYWRLGMEPGSGNRTHCVEGTWGAQIIDDLKPRENEQVVVGSSGESGFRREGKLAVQDYAQEPPPSRKAAAIRQKRVIALDSANAGE